MTLLAGLAPKGTTVGRYWNTDASGPSGMRVVTGTNSDISSAVAPTVRNGKGITHHIDNRVQISCAGLSYAGKHRGPIDHLPPVDLCQLTHDAKSCLR